jgi:hypothetical protein
MEKYKRAFKKGFTRGWTLFWSPLVGAVDGVKAAAHRPKATNWQEFIVNDIRLFCAPLTGAIGGMVKALKNAYHNER